MMKASFIYADTGEITEVLYECEVTIKATWHANAWMNIGIEHLTNTISYSSTGSPFFVYDEQ